MQGKRGRRKRVSLFNDLVKHHEERAQKGDTELISTINSTILLGKHPDSLPPGATVIARIHGWGELVIGRVCKRVHLDSYPLVLNHVFMLSSDRYDVAGSSPQYYYQWRIIEVLELPAGAVWEEFYIHSIG